MHRTVSVRRFAGGEFWKAFSAGKPDCGDKRVSFDMDRLSSSARGEHGSSFAPAASLSNRTGIAE
jgi:hypothetical protein